MHLAQLYGRHGCCDRLCSAYGVPTQALEHRRKRTRFGGIWRTLPRFSQALLAVKIAKIRVIRFVVVVHAGIKNTLARPFEFVLRVFVDYRRLLADFDLEVLALSRFALGGNKNSKLVHAHREERK